MPLDIRSNPMLNTVTAPESHRVLKWLVLVALVLFILTVMLFWFGGTSFNDRDVVVTLEGPSQALSGDEAVYTLKYANNTGTTLRGLSFRMFYPEQSIVLKEDDTFSQELSEGFEVQELPSGASGEKEFHAFLIGDKGSIKTAKVNLIFAAGGLRSSFEKSQTVSTTIIGLPVPLTLVAPPSAVSGDTVTYILDYRNESDADIADARFEFSYPEGFVPSRAMPAASEGSNVWSVPFIRKGSGSRITISGVLVGSERDEKKISVVLKRKIQDSYLDYERAESSTIMSSPLLNVATTVNGSRDTTASPGDTLSYLVQYRNASNLNLLGLNLAVKLEGDMYDISSLDTGGGFFDGATNTIVWNAGAVSDFANLPPGRSGTVDFRIKLKQNFPPGVLGAKSFFVKATTVLATPNVPTGLDTDQIAAQDSITTKISTQPALSTLIFYNDPAFGSSGPLPPQVGKETVFTVHWQVSNPGNDMGSVVVKAVLPPGVSWKNIVSSGASQAAPTYDRNRSEVTWNVGTLSHGVGVVSPKYDASFQVSITPSVAQKGTSPILIKATSFSGTDSFTKQNIVLTNSELTTSDLIDRPNQGMVQ